jgi:hypothetical protein
LIRSRLADYQAASSRKEKDDIARQIAATVRSRAGLFLRKIESPEEAHTLGVPAVPPDGQQDTSAASGAGGTGSAAAAAGVGAAGGSAPLVKTAAWTCVDESAVLVKVKQALRDQGLEAEQEEKKKNKSSPGGDGGATGGTATSSSTSQRRRKRAKVISSSQSAAAASSSSVQSGGGGVEPGSASAERNRDVKIAAASTAAASNQANNAAMQQQLQQQQHSATLVTPSLEMSDAALISNLGGGTNVTNTQHALLLNQIRQQQLRRQQYELEQQRNAAQLGYRSGGGGVAGDFPLDGQGVLGGSIIRGGGEGEGGGNSNILGGGGGMMAPFPEQLTNMDNTSTQIRRASAEFGNQHLASLRPGPRSLLNTAASSSSSAAMNYPSSSNMSAVASSSLPFARAGALQNEYRVLPFMGGVGGGNTSLAQATNFHLGRPELAARDMMMMGGGGGGTGFMGSANNNAMMMMGRGDQDAPTSIETVLQQAVKLCQQLHAIMTTTAGGGGAGARKRFPDQFLSLTQIESCILTVLCSTGFPLWLNSPMKSATPQAATAGPLDNANENSWSAAFSLTWVNVANLVLKEASNAIKDSSASSSSSPLVAIASHYCKNPKDLAQATVMLLEKIRQHGDYDNKSSSLAPPVGSLKSDQAAEAFLMSSSSAATRAPLKKDGHGGVGGMMMRPGLFLEAELARWGSSLDVADSISNPVAFCIADFLNSYPLVLRHDIVTICAVLDAASCKSLFNHVANLSRLRDTFQKIPKDHLLASLGQPTSTDPASSSMASSLAFLDRLPGTSQEERAHLDYSLLRSILELGFFGFFRNNTNTENLLLLTLRRAGLTKPAIEQRATLLIQALHAHFDARKHKLVIEEHNVKTAGLIAMAMAS